MVAQMKKVLVAYSSRFGSTEEIAIDIVETLEDEGIEVKLLNLRKITQIPDITNYDGILVGSGIMQGEWTEESLAFLKQYRETLNKTVLGLFVSSGEAANPKLYFDARNKYLKRLVEKFEFTNDPEIEAFGGVFDLSPNSIHSEQEKKILKQIILSDTTGFIVNDGKLSDFRNWQKIRDWTRFFARKVIATEDKLL